MGNEASMEGGGDGQIPPAAAAAAAGAPPPPAAAAATAKPPSAPGGGGQLPGSAAGPSSPCERVTDPSASDSTSENSFVGCS
ncbi:uncharacterized protein VSU04_008505 [Chlamydotis macqueenii]